MLQRGPRGREVHSLLDAVLVTKVVSLGVGGSTGTERVRQRVRSLLMEDSLLKGRRGEECVKRDTVVADVSPLAEIPVGCADTWLEPEDSYRVGRGVLPPRMCRK